MRKKIAAFRLVLLLLVFCSLVRLVIHCRGRVNYSQEFVNKIAVKIPISKKKSPKPKKKIKITGALPDSVANCGVDAFEISEKLRVYDDNALGRNVETGEPGKKVVFLTFDDGPSSTNTPKILDILKVNEVKATFFVLGSRLESDTGKELLQRTLLEGHAIGNHTYSHEYSYLYPGRELSLNNFAIELKKTDSVMKQALGEEFSTRVVRCPGGAMSWRKMEPLFEYFRTNNMASIDWNALNGDAEGKKKNAEELLQFLKKETGNKEMVVVLMHDTYGKEETVKSLQSAIDFFKSAEFEFKILV